METKRSFSRGNISTHFERYIREQQFCGLLRKETIRGYSEVFNLFLRIMPEITDTELLTSDMVIEFFRRLETRNRQVGKQIKTGVKSSTVKTYWSKLNVFFVWLCQNGFLERNPLEKMKPPQVVFDDARALSQDEVRKLYAAITLHSSNTFLLRRDTAIISLFVYCGLRRGEMLSLEVRDIDFEKRLLTVRGLTSKSKKIRLIPIHPTLLLHLKDYVSMRNKVGYKTHYLINPVYEDKQLSYHGLKHWVNSLNSSSGVQFHLHQLRHSFACYLAEQNVNIVKIQKLLGHSSLNMTMFYLRSLRIDAMSDDINKINF